MNCMFRRSGFLYYRGNFVSPPMVGYFALLKRRFKVLREAINILV
jgi:hypothetical protein